MSYSITDSLDSKPIEIAYGAAQLALPRTVGRAQRTRVVRQHLASNRAKHALLVRGDADSEVWWVGDTPGVSLAAAIETWLDGEAQPPEQCGVLLPLDLSIYCARIEHNLVVDERILPLEKAEEEAATATDQGRVVYAFAGGGTGQALARQIPLEPLPFDPFAYVFAPAWKVFLKNRMLHAAHLVGLGAIALALAALLATGPVAERLIRSGWTLLAGYLPWTAEQTETRQTSTPATVITPQVAYSAARQLGRLAELLLEVEGLHRDGLARLSYAGGAVTLSGQSAYAFPDAAREYARAADAKWTFSAAGWTISQALEVAEDRGPPAITARDAIKRLAGALTLTAGPEALRGSTNLLANTVTRPLHKITYAAALEGAAVGTLLDSAQLLQGMPAAVTQADCEFADWQIANCQLSIEVMTL